MRGIVLIKHRSIKLSIVYLENNRGFTKTSEDVEGV